MINGSDFKGKKMNILVCKWVLGVKIMVLVGY